MYGIRIWILFPLSLNQPIATGLEMNQKCTVFLAGVLCLIAGQTTDNCIMFSLGFEYLRIKTDVLPVSDIIQIGVPANR